MAVLSLALVGATGRTGRHLVRALNTEAEARLVAALSSPANPALGRDAGELLGAGQLGVPLTAELDAAADVIVDFSTPNACTHWAEVAAERGIPFVSGTTGLDEQQTNRIAEVARAVAVVHAPNMAPAVNVLASMLRQAAQALGNGFDTSIVEVHHRAKRDAPSGTALALARALIEAGASEPDIASLRLGGRAGEHAVHFAAEDESLVLTHTVSDRRVYARGALRAARWVQDRAPGLFDMNDVLGLS